ncbi:MAG: hypothetical protein IJ796_04025 [Lachnospiraceae bacterium]|nr:hypothetical protein [Lachnospiraceae bacterium]
MDKKYKRNLIIVVSLVFAAWFLNLWIFNQTAFVSLLRDTMYFGLFIMWGLSVRKRIVSNRPRRYMFLIACLVVFWLFVRILKYRVFFAPVVKRYLWYSYYIPLLTIPTICLFTAISLGKSDNYRFPRWLSVVIAISMMLSLAVMSNDLHQGVFRFSESLHYANDSDYSYGPIYYAIFVWEVIIGLSSFVMIILRCRVGKTRRRLWLPLIPISVLVIYSLFYALGFQFYRYISNDLSIMCCVCIISSLEACIYTGLIASNTGYESLFLRSSIGGKIVDYEGNVIYKAINSPELSGEEIRKARHGDFRVGYDTLIKSHRIKGGNIIWREDVSNLNEVIAELEETEGDLKVALEIEHQNYEKLGEIKEAREKNRLYNKVIDSTKSRMDEILRLTDEYERADKEEKERIFKRIILLATFVKRRGNLVFIAEKNNAPEIEELYYCLRESFTALELMGIEGSADFGDIKKLSAKDMLDFYERFEETAEENCSLISGVRVYERSGDLHLDILRKGEIMYELVF